MLDKLKIITVTSIFFFVSSITLIQANQVQANEDCYQLIPRIKVMEKNKYNYSKQITKEIFKDTNKTLCISQNGLNDYYQSTLKYFIETKGYYIPPIVKVEYPEEKSIFYVDFLINFQHVNKILFTGKGENGFFKYLTHLNQDEHFLTSRITDDQQFFNSLGYLKLDAFDINQTSDGKFDAIYTINQDNNWSASISLSNSQSEVYNSYGDLSSYFSVDLYNPLGLAWQYNLSGSSSRLHSEDASFSEYYNAGVTIPYKSFRFNANFTASNNVVESSTINVRTVSQSFYQGEQTSQSYTLSYNTFLNEQIGFGTSFAMKMNQNKNLSFVNAQGQANLPVEDDNNYALSTFAINGSYSHPKIYLNSEIQYSQLIDSLSNVKSQEIYYNPSTYYKNDYSFINYNISAYIPINKWINYSISLDGQSTNEILRDSHKFGAGDRNSVRGYGNNYYVSSDNGYYIKNDFTIPINNIINPYIAYDYASLTPTVKNVFGYDTVKFSGAALGSKGELYKIQYDFFLAKPIDNTLSNFRNEYTVGYSLNYSF